MRANDSIRSIKAQKRIDGRLDFIVEIYEDSRFVEITGRVGGDVVVYRVYDDGSITEK